MIVRSEVLLILEFFCGCFWCFLCIFCNHPTLFNSFSFVHWVSPHLTLLSFLPALLVLFLPALLVLPALLYRWGTLTGFFFFFLFILFYTYVFFSLIFVQDCCCMAVTYEGFCRMRTDGTRCMIFSSFKDTVHMY